MLTAKQAARNEMIAALAEFDAAMIRARHSADAMDDVDAAEKRLAAAELAYETSAA
jgi:hypothetical protein